MYSSSLLVLALAVFGASAQTLLSSGCGVGGIVGGCSSVAAVGGCGTPQVIENIPVRLPSIIHQASVQDTCNCIKTVVRPHFRKEVFTIPSVQRFVQTTSTPVVETLPYVTGSSADIPSSSGCVSGIETGLVGVGGYGSGLVNGGIIGGGLVNGGLVNGGLVNGGLVSGGLVNGGCGAGLVNGGIIGGGLVSSGCGVVSGINSGCGCAY